MTALSHFIFCEVRLSDLHVRDEASLLEALRPRLLYFVLRRLRDRSLAEEIVQDTMIAVMQALRDDRFDDPANLPAYAFGVAKHLVSRTLRTRTIETNPGVGPGQVDAPWVEDSEAALLLEEQRQQVREALAHVSSSDRDILERTFVAEESLEEIAAATGTPYAAVRKRKSRALQRLRKIFLERSQKR